MTKINRKGINKHMTYTLKELGELLGVNVKTLQRWMETGLKTIPGCKRPILISGANLKEFLQNKDSKKKVRLKRGQFYCFKCKAARYAKKGSTRTLSDRKTALCGVCSGKMSRTIKPYQKDYTISLFPI